MTHLPQTAVKVEIRPLVLAMAAIPTVMAVTATPTITDPMPGPPLPPRPRRSLLRPPPQTSSWNPSVRALIQRVSSASVSIDSENLGSITTGLVVLLGVGEGDTQEDARYIVDKTLNLRVFPDDAGRFDRSLMDINGELLVVSQFTLYADTRKGRRPSFTGAALPEAANPLYESTVELFKASCPHVVTGRFAEHMLVDIQNDGPVTIMLDSADREKPRRG